MSLLPSKEAIKNRMGTSLWWFGQVQPALATDVILVIGTFFHVLIFSEHSDLCLFHHYLSSKNVIFKKQLLPIDLGVPSANN